MTAQEEALRLYLRVSMPAKGSVEAERLLDSLLAKLGGA